MGQNHSVFGAWALSSVGIFLSVAHCRAVFRAPRKPRLNGCTVWNIIPSAMAYYLWPVGRTGQMGSHGAVAIGFFFIFFCIYIIFRVHFYCSVVASYVAFAECVSFFSFFFSLSTFSIHNIFHFVARSLAARLFTTTSRLL